MFKTFTVKEIPQEAKRDGVGWGIAIKKSATTTPLSHNVEMLLMMGLGECGREFYWREATTEKALHRVPTSQVFLALGTIRRASGLGRRLWHLPDTHSSWWWTVWQWRTPFLSYDPDACMTFSKLFPMVSFLKTLILTWEPLEDYIQSQRTACASEPDSAVGF